MRAAVEDVDAIAAGGLVGLLDEAAAVAIVLAVDVEIEVAEPREEQIARALGKARTQVQRWIRRYGIDVDRYR